MAEPVRIRRTLDRSDPARIGDLVAATGFFSAEETAIAMDLAQEFLTRHEASGYRFLLAEDDEGLVGYACYGPIPGTGASWDIYWIAVRARSQGRGVGRRIMAIAEQDVAETGGSRVYIDTSSRAQYEPTRRFYEACGYQVAATLPDFYAPGDGKIIYCRVLGRC